MNALPTLACLQAFESAARHRSFTRAAAELHRTQSAVSQQIRLLEQQLGIALFERVRQRVVITGAGVAYLADVQRMLAELAEATHRVMAAGGQPLLNLGVLPSFGAIWLIHRLPRFRARHPDIGINFVSRNLPFDFRESNLDAAIHYGEPIWAGAAIHFLMHEDKVAVCSPAFRRRHAIAAAADLVRLPLLQLRSVAGAWADWFAHMGVAAGIDTTRGLRFDSFNMIAEAAKAGLGAGLLPRFLVRREIEAGRLVLAAAGAVPGRRAYYFVCPEEKATMSPVVAFRDWIIEEAAREQDGPPAAFGVDAIMPGR